jgi:hypothetical protein
LGINVGADVAEYAFVKTTMGTRDLTGVLVASLRKLTQVGGMDVGMQGWGAEDIDLRLALHCEGSGKQKLLPPRLFAAIAHDDDVRSANYSNSDINATLQVNLRRMVANYYLRTGRKLEDDWSQPALLEVLGYGPILQALGMELR